MRTLMIERGGSAPDELREIVERGSTELVREQPANDRGVDRVVIWDAKRPSEASAAGADRWPGTVEVFVIAPEASGQPPAPNATVLSWPADADRLKMAFMTGG